MINERPKSQLFHEISALLTGFSETEIMATGMLESYYNTIAANSDRDDLEYFFRNVDAILRDPSRTEQSTESAIATQLMPNSSYGSLARNIIILWYTGNWGNNPVSSAAYIQGLMWDSGHTHPPGAKQPGYGSWANAPISVR
jgi:hypothetical protein